MKTNTRIHTTEEWVFSRLDKRGRRVWCRWKSGRLNWVTNRAQASTVTGKEALDLQRIYQMLQPEIARG